MVEGCSEEKDARAERLCASVGPDLGTDRVIPLFDFSECDGDGREVAIKERPLSFKGQPSH